MTLTGAEAVAIGIALFFAGTACANLLAAEVKRRRVDREQFERRVGQIEREKRGGWSDFGETEDPS